MKYTAEDGTLFLTERECLAYENKIRQAEMDKVKDYFTFFDDDLDYLSYNSRYRPAYIRIESNFEKVADWINKYADYDATGIESNGIYAWDEDTYCWITLDKLIERHEKIIENIKSIRDEILI
jgi:hypothetical protein